MLIRLWRRMMQRATIACCSHGPWVILQRSENIWCGGFVALEFCRSKDRPKGWPSPSWHARVAVCSKCGGVIDEITFAEHALGDKKSVMVYPDEYAPLLRGCGTIWDWL